MVNLSPERWRQIDRVFAHTLERPPDARSAFLRSACGTDSELYREVLALIESAGDAEAALGESATAYAAPLLHELKEELIKPPSDAPPDHLLGAYRIVREIGRGGMGRVYLAERADGQFEREVALKLVKRGMDTDEIMRRFRYERQILASLQHPNIAQLHDGGIATDGRPYLVMEYVEGTPLDRYCDAHRLTVDDRLHLFLKVLDAVRYAHQKLVVHRDLKPSNILVTQDGQVKLLDFGIAKLLSDEEDGFTQAGMRMMTPHYAAPEQKASGAVTAATDTYTLGVVLFELLTGHRLFDVDASSSGELAGLEHEPRRLSTTITRPTVRRHRNGTTDSVTPEEVSRARGTSPGRLRRRLQGDLDVIVSKALRIEPERRYVSVDAFLGDIERHVNGLPVLARSDTAGYRLRKFARRHRYGVAAVAGFVTVLAIGLAIHTAQITQERNIARQERDKAEEVSAFLEGLFDASDPFAPERLDTMQVRTLLHRGTMQFRDHLEARPLVRSEMLQVIGRVYRRLGMYDEARPLLEQALASRQRAQPGEHLEIAEIQAELGMLLTDVGDHQAADSLLQQALALRRSYHREPHAEIALSLNHLAELRRIQGEFDEAERLQREALRMLRAMPGEDHPQVAVVMSSLASTLERKGEYAFAGPFIENSLELRRSLYGSNHPSVAMGLNDLALLRQRMGEYEAAEAAIREALAISTAALGEDHPYVGTILQRLGSILWWKGELYGAERYHREALALWRRIYGDMHIEIAVSLSDLGSVLRDQGNYEASVAAIREAVAIARRLLGEDHSDVAIFTGNLASSVQLLGDCTEAERLYAEAIDGIRRTMPEDRQRIPALKRWLGRCLTEQGRYLEAETTLLDSYRMLHDERGVSDKYTRQALSYLVELYEAWSKPEEAARYDALISGAVR